MSYQLYRNTSLGQTLQVFWVLGEPHLRLLFVLFAFFRVLVMGLFVHSTNHKYLCAWFAVGKVNKAPLHVVHMLCISPIESHVTLTNSWI